MTGTSRRRPEASALAAFAALIACGTAAADDPAEEHIARCAAAASAEERIACLERSLRELAGTPTAGDAAPRATAETAVDDVPPALAAGEPADPTPPGAAAEAVAAEAAPGTATADPSVAAREAPAPAPAVELGAEQVEARSRTGDDDAPRVRARVVDFRFVGYERLMVQLDNGQIWRQIDGDRESVARGLRNADTFEVEMWATKLGGYRMRILPLGRTIRVERLR